MRPVDILGYVAGFLVVGSLLPQAIKSWRTKSTKDLSLPRYVVYITGLVLWIIYGLIINNGPIVVINCVGLTLASFILYLIIKYKK